MEISNIAFIPYVRFVSWFVFSAAAFSVFGTGSIFYNVKESNRNAKKARYNTGSFSLRVDFS